MATEYQLNHRARQIVDAFLADAELLRIAAQRVAGNLVVDCGIDASGGLNAGLQLASVCTAGLADVSLAMHPLTGGPAIQVPTDSPVAACMASQYAGWEVKGDDFFAMGSGPMRAAYGREELFGDIAQYREKSDLAVGVLESGTLPTEAVCRDIAEKCGVAPDMLALLVAPTNSQAGNVQVVARSIETALHKLHELGFDLHRIESGWGIAPLPPVAADALFGIGRTNDAILYGGRVVLYLRGEDASDEVTFAQTPSSASNDHGRPFQEIFAAYDHDFYKIDKHLFSPAVVEFVNLDTGKSWRFGAFALDVLEASFGSQN